MGVSHSTLAATGKVSTIMEIACAVSMTIAEIALIYGQSAKGVIMDME